MRGADKRSIVRIVGILAVVWVVAAVTAGAIRRAATPDGRRRVVRRAERTGRELLLAGVAGSP